MYRKEIEEFVEAHRQEMLEDICTLCRINSEKMPYKEGMPYGEGAFTALAEALSMAENYGFSITNYDNYVGTVDLNEKESQLDILAHLDVVPAGEGWKETEPFEPVVKGDKLFGRGTADDKGPAVAALYAMRAVKELGIPLKKNARLILGTDEECGSSDITHYYAIEKEAPMTFSPDGSYPVVNTEKGGLNGHFTASFAPSDALPKLVSVEAGIKVNVVPGKARATVQGIDVEVMEKAAEEVSGETGIRFEFDVEEDAATITAIGAGAHASKPEEGNNALTGLLVLIQRLPFAPCEQISAIGRLLELIPHGDTSGKALGIAMSDELSGDLTLAFSLLTISDRELDGTFDSRCPVCATKENVLEVAKAKMAEKGFTLLNDSMKPPHHVDGDSEFIRTLLRTYEEYTGRTGECIAIGGGTYVHELKNGVAFGAAMPETDNRMHGADEFAVIEELIVSAKMFAQVIVDLCS
ncbi:MAG: Sapep family Mn(2+)-dependent dipeptidase [Clostridiaceae bacterium]|nr:Sapep family Mn(2+)-dependent dipeptidase [Clostridiaceae bacterium]